MIPSFVICGVEHSATTTLSDVFREVPDYDSGFEVGVLLCDTPNKFRKLEPFISNIKAGWGLVDHDLDYLCDTTTYAEFYTRLLERSTLVNKTAKFFDKTPRYFSQLPVCMERVDVPFIVTYKDPRAIVLSDYQRSSVDDFEDWFENYKEKKNNYLKLLYKNMQIIKNDAVLSKRAIFVSMENFCVNTAATLKEVFSHCNIPFTFKYIFLDKVRFKNTRGHFIDSRMPFYYLNAFNSKQIRIIEKHFSELADWFYS